jgi:hypothetical protein
LSGGGKFLDGLRIFVLGPIGKRTLRVYLAERWIVGDDFLVEFVGAIKLASIRVGIFVASVQDCRTGAK